MTITDKDVREALADLLHGYEGLEDSLFDGSSSKTYEDAQLLTNDEGLVVRLSDGSQFQITIVQSGGGF